MFAFAPTPWNYAVQFTPYVLSACFTGLILLAALGWWRRAEHSDSAGRLFLLFLLLGLDFSVHRTNSLLLPAALVWVALRRGGASLRRGAGPRGAGARDRTGWPPRDRANPVLGGEPAGLRSRPRPLH